MEEVLDKSKRKANLRKILGTLIFLMGVVFVLNSFTITGNVVMDRVEEGMSLGFGLILVVVGAALFFLTLEKRILKLKRKLEQAKKSGQMGSYDDLRRIAKKMDYELKEGSRHSEVFHQGQKITEIPRHSGNEKKGTYNGIRDSLIKYAS